uniref:ubiquitinyl hydrolase 1 n=1 Tax=Parascaris univalens TaxID=6257 RepID=A0A915B122_PARUN
MHDDNVDVHVQAVEKFVAITQTTPSFARVFLEDDGWDVAASVQRFNIWSKKDEEPQSISPSTSDDKVEEGNNENNYSSEGKWSWDVAKRFEMPSCAFVLPNLSELAPEFRRFLEEDLIETTILKKLENSGHLNWWCCNGGGQRLWPLSTTGDGNCLLHAASLGLWGVHDRHLMLRKTLHEMITQGSRRHTLYRRWRFAESKANQESGLTLSDDEWQKEWQILLDSAAATPRKNTQRNELSMETESEDSEQVYASLETIHVFALAHVLKRSIIVVSDTVLRNAMGEELAPIPFGGIYLPLECPPEQCSRSPLVLCYDSAHFSAVVTMRPTPNSTLLPIIPIVDKERNLLPVHFSVDPGPDFTWWKDAEDDEIASRIELTEADRLSLICEYLDISKIEVRRGSHRRSTLTRQGQNDDTNKSMTLACGGDLAKKHLSSGIIFEIAQHIRNKFRSSARRKNTRKRFIDAVTVADLRYLNLILVAHLDNCVHEYMEHMVDSYMYYARQRFEQAKRTPASVARQRNRISRSFSTSSLLIKCINVHCEKVASQSTNFLCADCYEYQRQLMASFGTRPGRLRSLRSGTTADRGDENDSEKKRNTGRSIKSSTMPSIGSSNADNGAGDHKHIGEETPRRTVHTVAVHDAQHPFESITTKVSSVEGANGVTHYYISS